MAATANSNTKAPSNGDLIDEACITLTSADGIIQLLKAQFELLDERPTVSDKTIHAALHAVDGLLEDALSKMVSMSR